MRPVATQLRLPLRSKLADRIAVVYARAAEKGWEPEPHGRGNGNQLRYHLPGTHWYLRANWHCTTLYALEGRTITQAQHIPTDALGKITLALDKIRVQTASTRTQGGVTVWRSARCGS